MDASDLLRFFSAYSNLQLAEVRHSAVVDQFPSDPAVYVKIAEEFFTEANWDIMVRQRVEWILREFVYYDGRTFEALLTIAERSPQTMELPNNGIGALAGICCHLNLGRPLRIPKPELLAAFDRLAKNEALRHNAIQCRLTLLARYPDDAGGPR